MATQQKIFHDIQSDRPVQGGRELHLTYRSVVDHPIPAILLLPSSPAATGIEFGASPEFRAKCPGVVLVHGYSSRKEDVSGPLGRSLLSRGIASLALDLPLHGGRISQIAGQSFGDPMQFVSLWRQGLKDVRLGLHYLGARPEIDKGRLALVGYSLGSYLSTVVAAEERKVRALVVAAGGDLPKDTPFTTFARMFVDPLVAVKKLNGRPLLIVHGRSDRTVLPDRAQRLYDAATEPKKLIWYDSGHRLPAAAVDAAMEWLEQRLN
jgi:fermentation-respiration switch protein FrsA (DUF1100 family)